MQLLQVTLFSFCDRLLFGFEFLEPAAHFDFPDMSVFGGGRFHGGGE